MLLYNADLDEAEQASLFRAIQVEDENADICKEDSCQAFFDLRQRALVGMEQLPAFRIVAFGLLRKLRTNLRGTVLYGEVEDAFSRYFRLLDVDMQKFVSLHETLNATVEKEESESRRVDSQMAAALSTLKDSMRQVAVVLMACGEMQKRALELKIGAQQSISASDGLAPPLVSFAKFAEFLEDSMAVSDQLKRKHEEMQNTRMQAMASVVSARASKKPSAPESPDASKRTDSSSPRPASRQRWGIPKLGSKEDTSSPPGKSKQDPRGGGRWLLSAWMSTSSVKEGAVKEGAAKEEARTPQSEVEEEAT